MIGTIIKHRGAQTFALIFALAAGVIASYAFIAKADPGVTLGFTDVSLDEGTSTKLSVQLNTIPTSTVTITPSFDADLVTVSPASLDISDSKSHLFTIAALDNSENTGDISTSVTFDVTSEDIDYSGATAGPIDVTIVENDNPALNISLSSTALTEGSGYITATLTLATAPDVDVTFAVNSKALTVSNAIFSPTTVTFTPSDWDQGHDVQISLTDDSEDLGTQTSSITFAETGDTVINNYSGVSGTSDEITFYDNDGGGRGGRGGDDEGGDADKVLLLDPESLDIKQDSSATFDLSLRADPGEDAEIIIDNTNGNVSVSPSSVNVGSTNWNIPQTVTVTATGKASDSDVLTFAARICTSSIKGDPVCNDYLLDADTLPVTITAAESDGGKDDSGGDTPSETPTKIIKSSGGIGGGTKGQVVTATSKVAETKNSTSTQSTKIATQSKLDTSSVRVLTKGTADSEVTTVQKFLNTTLQLGLKLDGKLGDETRAAIEAFQKGAGIKVDGIVGPQTRTAVNKIIEADGNETGSLHEGTKGGRVIVLQRLLSLKGISLSIDGILGPKTRDAIVKFQLEHGLTVDGIAGPKTLFELQK